MHTPARLQSLSIAIKGETALSDCIGRATVSWSAEFGIDSWRHIAERAVRLTVL
jgi:hypothetical protein